MTLIRYENCAKIDELINHLNSKSWRGLVLWDRVNSGKGINFRFTEENDARSFVVQTSYRICFPVKDDLYAMWNLLGDS